MIEVIVKEDSVGLLNIEIDGVNFGVFEDIDGTDLAWFPRRTERLSGEQIVAIGVALTEANEKKLAN